HDIGDQLLHTPFIDPIMDMEMITITYTEVRALLKDLTATGAHHVYAQDHRVQGCTSPRAFQKMLAAYEAFKYSDNTYPATFEVLYGHAVNPPEVLHRNIPTKLKQCAI